MLGLTKSEILDKAHLYLNLRRRMGMDKRPAEYQEVEFMISANDFERHELWREWHKKIASWDAEPELAPLNEALTIGKIEGRPIVVAFSWYRLDGHLVGFYHACSEVVDYLQVDAWLGENCLPPGDGRRQTNAMNFADCLNSLDVTIKE